MAADAPDVILEVLEADLQVLAEIPGVILTPVLDHVQLRLHRAGQPAQLVAQAHQQPPVVERIGRVKQPLLPAGQQAVDRLSQPQQGIDDRIEQPVQQACRTVRDTDVPGQPAAAQVEQAVIAPFPDRRHQVVLEHEDDRPGARMMRIRGRIIATKNQEIVFAGLVEKWRMRGVEHVGIVLGVQWQLGAGRKLPAPVGPAAHQVEPHHAVRR